MKKRQLGYTLLELMIVVAVLGVVMGVAAPNFSKFLRKQAVKADAQIAVKALGTARVQAMTIELASSLVCWNLSSSDITITDGTTSEVVSPNNLATSEGSLTGLGPLISMTQLTQGTVAVYDNDTDNCIGFDAQGRLTGASTIPFGFTYCRGSGETTDALRVEVSNSGRVSTKLNTNTTGLGVHSCT